MNALPGLKRCPCPDHEGPRWLSSDAFRQVTSTKDGLTSWCRACHVRQHRDERTWLRNQVFDHYGRVCACPGCGATDNLTIDHPNGDGLAHRMEVFGGDGKQGTGKDFYRWLIKQGFPAGYQTLCASCNSSKQKGLACRIDHANSGLKRCTCPEHEGPNPLPLDAFGKDSHQRDGLHTLCRTCTNQRQRQRRQGTGGRDEQLAATAEIPATGGFCNPGGI